MEKNQETEKYINISLENKSSKFDNKIKIISLIIELVTGILSLAVASMAIYISVNVNQMQKQQQQQDQVQEQMQIVIEPREGDIIVSTSDGNYKLLQAITVDDVHFPKEIQEKKYKYDDPLIKDQKYEYVNKKDQKGWEEKNRFSYIINTFSINPNKIINLLDNIKSIKIYCDFYEKKNISTKITLKHDFVIDMYSKDVDYNELKLSYNNEKSEYLYVTYEGNNGFEYAKMRVEIKYEINNKIITDEIVSDWYDTRADVFA